MRISDWSSDVCSSDLTGGYVALTKLPDLNKFLRNAEGKPFGHIFDENVRAYQGSVEVNKGIKDTLENPGAEDFWWLNNGVTILAQEASQVGKTIKIGRAHVRTPVTNANIVCRLLLETNKRKQET